MEVKRIQVVENRAQSIEVWPPLCGIEPVSKLESYAPVPWVLFSIIVAIID